MSDPLLPEKPAAAGSAGAAEETKSGGLMSMLRRFVSWDSTPPRVAAAGHTFGMLVDDPAREFWQMLGTCRARGADEKPDARLLSAAAAVARELHFLELAVQSREEAKNGERLRRADTNNVLPRFKKTNLECYAVMAAVPSSAKAELIEAAAQVLQASRAMGALVGMAVGDAAGAPLEFIDAVDAKDPRHNFDPVTFKVTGASNKFAVREGQWTDDSSMGLCLADSLLARRRLDCSDVRIRFWNWWFLGYNNAFGNDTWRAGSVGLGGNVAKSLYSLREGQVPTPSYVPHGRDSEDAGNGSLMRLAAVPIFYCHNPAWAACASATSSSSTHPGPMASAACAFFGYAIARAIMRDDTKSDAKAFLDAVVKDFTDANLPQGRCRELQRLLRSAEPVDGKEACWNWRSPTLQVKQALRARGHTYNGYPCTASYFGSYCMDGLAVALWGFYHSTSFTDAVVRCVNVLGDADTNGAICGQLAGAFYGYDAIDRRFLERLKSWDDGDIACRAALLFAVRPRELPGGASGKAGWAPPGCPATEPPSLPPPKLSSAPMPLALLHPDAPEHLVPRTPAGSPDPSPRQATAPSGARRA